MVIKANPVRKARRNPREKQPEFFFCDVFDALPKGDMVSMEHPVFALTTNPDVQIREYENNGVSLRVIPSVLGMATVFDRDILIYCISQIMAALNRRRDVTQIVRFRAIDMMTATNRNTSGAGYNQLKAALERLAGTRISTNIVTGEDEIFNTFGLIESAEIVRKTRTGRMQEIEIKLSDWLFNAIEHNEVLTLSRDYFQLRKPLERRLYEIARKHCGAKADWKIGLELLQQKCGSNTVLADFRRIVKGIVKDDQEREHIPEYAITFDGTKDMVVFKSRKVIKPVEEKPKAIIRQLNPDIYDAIRALVPGCDVYAMEQEWRAWSKKPPRDPEMAFLGFCRNKADK